MANSNKLKEIIIESIKKSNYLDEKSNSIPMNYLPLFINDLRNYDDLKYIITNDLLNNLNSYFNDENLINTSVTTDQLIQLIQSLSIASPKHEDDNDFIDIDNGGIVNDNGDSNDDLVEPLEEINFDQFDNSYSSVNNVNDFNDGHHSLLDNKTPRSIKFKKPKAAHKVIKSSSSISNLSDITSDSDISLSAKSPNTTSPPLSPSFNDTNYDYDSFNGLNGLLLSNYSNQNVSSFF